MWRLLEDTVPGEELRGREEVYHAEVREGSVRTESQLLYGQCLVRSKYKGDILKGIRLLEDLFYNQNDASAADCLLYLSAGYSRLGEYQRGLKYIRLLLEVEPANREAAEVEAEVRRRLRREGLFGLAVVSGGLALLAGAVAVFVYRTRRR